MLSSVMLLLSTTFLSTASAQMFYLDPQVRVGAGASWSDGSIGASVSMDTRMTQLLYIGIGAFRSLQLSEIVVDEADIQTWTKLRHSIWAAPGLRFPHRYKKNSINWDILIRTGFACVFSELGEKDDWILMEPAALGGGDFILFKDRFVLKTSGKIFVYNPYIPEFRKKELIYRPQVSVELTYQW